MRPFCQDGINASQGWVECRRVEPSIIGDPATDFRIEHPRQFIQGLVTAFMERPAAHGLPDRLESFVAGCWTERDANLPTPSSRQPRPERVAEKVELRICLQTVPPSEGAPSFNFL